VTSMTSITVRTSRPIEALDITNVVLNQELPQGVILVSVPHTTAALMLSEAEDDLLLDLEKVAATWAPRYEPFRHCKNNNPNAAAHLLSAIIGSQVLVVADEGRARLGPYQRLVLLELDGPKERQIYLQRVTSSVGPDS
jgi:secondary thiamine-phosphate synthase enzyme